MKLTLSKSLNGPIPGENYLQDTKNYPWHRPPEMTDFVEVVTKIHKKMSTPQNIGKLKVFMAGGETILEFVTGMLRISVGEGKIPIDTAVLAAGPFARMCESICEEGGFEYKRGWDQEEEIPTVANLEFVAGVGRNKPVPKVPDGMSEDPAPAAAPAAGGFMSAPSGAAPVDEQSAMLGQTE